MYRMKSIALAVTVAALAIGCIFNSAAMPSTQASPISQAGVPSPTDIQGIVIYPRIAAFMPKAIVTVQLVDITNAGISSLVMDKLVLTPSGKPESFGFKISYNPTTLNPDGMYAVEVYVEADGKLMYHAINKLGITGLYDAEPMRVILAPVGQLTFLEEAVVDGRLAHFTY
jgi:uncharacterized lipoprotein YbaY